MADVRLGEGLASNAQALLRLGRAMMTSGKAGQALALVRNALDRNRGNAELRQAARLVLSHGVPQWHSAMLRDDPRTETFDRAIRKAVRPGMRVLDIGTGSGLLAMMAARAGAAEVYACEAHPALAATAREIVAANGWAGQVRVLAKPSTELDADADLGGRVDLVIAEIFSDDLLGEKALSSLQHARLHLAQPDAAFIPGSASLRVALAWWDLEGQEWPEWVSGFDLSAFQSHILPYYRPRIGDKRLKLASDPQDLFSFDFAGNAAFAPGTTERELVAARGPANGVVQWIRLELDEAESYENRPEPGARSHWAAMFHPLQRPLAQGEAARLCAGHDTEQLCLWFV